MKKKAFKLAPIAALAMAAGLAQAGPVIIGGDDLTDHGFRSGSTTDTTGANNEGWLYIEKAVGNVLSSTTRAGAITHDIVALGATDRQHVHGRQRGGGDPLRGARARQVRALCRRGSGD